MSCDAADIALAQDLESLIALCALTAKHIADGRNNPRRLAADLHRCLVSASGLADQASQALRNA